MLKLNIQLFGGRGASSSTTKAQSLTKKEINKLQHQARKIRNEIEQGMFASNKEREKMWKEFDDINAKLGDNRIDKILEAPKTQETPSLITRVEEKIPTFTGNKNLEKALDNGYAFYRRDNLRAGGRNYREIVKSLKAEGYKVRVYEEATRVRGIHNYTILYKRGK